MIQNDAEKEWMLPLLEIRNMIDFRNHAQTGEEDRADRDLRDFRRKNGSVQLYFGRVIPGPYLKKYREKFLMAVLKAQETIRKTGPKEVAGIELLTLEELREIRRIWVIEKHELEDTLPGIYKEATGRDFPYKGIDDSMTIGANELAILQKMENVSEAEYEMVRSLIGIASQQKSGLKKAKLHDELERCFKRYQYDSEDEALRNVQELEAERNGATENTLDDDQQ